MAELIHVAAPHIGATDVHGRAELGRPLKALLLDVVDAVVAFVEQIKNNAE